MSQIRSKDLRLVDLHKHGVWTWSSDLYQAEDLLVAVSMKSEEGLAEFETLLIHAVFTLANGQILEGIIVYDLDLETVFAIELFIEDTRIALNQYLPDISLKELKQNTTLNTEINSQIFPIRFEAIPRTFSTIKGEFSF